MEMVEDFEALEEEGVSGSRKNKYVMREVGVLYLEWAMHFI